MPSPLDLSRACSGNQEALSFIKCGGDYLRVADDIMDKAEWTPDRLVLCFALAAQYYSHPFYLRHRDKLQMVALMGTVLWARSIKWEKEPELWKRRWADFLRHADVIVIASVVMICSGYSVANDAVGAFLSAAKVDHLDRYGEPE